MTPSLKTVKTTDLEIQSQQAQRAFIVLKGHIGLVFYTTLCDLKSKNLLHVCIFEITYVYLDNI